MSSTAYNKVSAFIFLIVGLVHIVRLGAYFPLNVAGWAVPRELSALGAVVSLLLAWWGLSSSRKGTAAHD